VIAIDFETYYTTDYSVSRMGYWAYTHDARFNAYLIGWVTDAGAGVCAPDHFDWAMLHDQDVIAHNANFDRAVFRRIQETGRAKDVQPRRWHCTADMASYLQCPRSLEGAAKAILGRTTDKTARKQAEGASTPDLFGMMTDYCKQDAQTCWDLWHKASQFWPEQERRLSRLTSLMGRHGVRLDVEFVKQQIATLTEAQADLVREIPWAGTSAIVSPVAFADCCQAAGIQPPASTEAGEVETVEWLETNADTVPGEALAAVIAYRKANRSRQVLQTMLDRRMPNERMEAHLLYCGATTGRWSGGGHGLNLQNLTTSTDTCDMRGCLIPDPGHSFLVIDLAQIEARILLWLAQDEKQLELIRSGISVYEAHARTTMGWQGGVLKTEDPQKYKLAKARVLGLGFGCGAEKFRWLAARADVHLTELEAKATVKEYRQANPGIVALWASLEQACKARDGKTYSMPLPSGRNLTYRNCKAQPGTAEQVKGRTTKIYGGLLCENMVQAIARDVFAHGLINLVDACARPVLLIHDEVVLECPTDRAEAALPFAIETFSATPKWAPGLPVGADGKIMQRYGK